MAETESFYRFEMPEQYHKVGQAEWRILDFIQKMKQLIVSLGFQDDATLNEANVPDTLRHLNSSPIEAFHFYYFAEALKVWQGEPIDEPFDALKYLRDSEHGTVSKLKALVSSYEQGLQLNNFARRTCSLEIIELKRCVHGLAPPEHKVMETTDDGFNALQYNMSCLEDWFEEAGISSKQQNLHFQLCRRLFIVLEDALTGLEAMVECFDHRPDSVRVEKQATAGIPETEAPHLMEGVRRRKPGMKPTAIPLEDNTETDESISEPIDHTEAWLLLVKSFRTVVGAYSWSELREALWEDERASVALSIILTSASSLLMGVAFNMHFHDNHSDEPGLDGDFFTLLSDTVLQLFSLYILLLPLLRGQEPYINGIWFGFSIGLSVTFSITACVTYAFSWHAAALLRFGGTLTSIIAALLLVQGINKGNSAKSSATTPPTV